MLPCCDSHLICVSVLNVWTLQVREVSNKQIDPHSPFKLCILFFSSVAKRDCSCASLFVFWSLLQYVCKTESMGFLITFLNVCKGNIANLRTLWFSLRLSMLCTAELLLPYIRHRIIWLQATSSMFQQVSTFKCLKPICWRWVRLN